MKLITRNIDLKPYRRSSAWRKIALSTWRNSEESSFYGWTDLDAEGILRVIRKFREEGKHLSPTTVAAKALAVSIAAYPRVNSLIRFGRIYERKDIDIFLQVAPDGSGENLTGIVIRQCDKKSLEEIDNEIRQRANGIRTGEMDEFSKITGMLSALPSFVIGLTLKFVNFLSYKLNVWSPLLGTPRDAFGSAMVTSVGMLGVQRGLAPFMPYYPCPIIVMVGKIEEKALAENGKVVVKEVLPITATFDHRLIDGVGASIMFKALKEYIADPY